MPTTRVAALLLAGALFLSACTTAVAGAPVPVPRPTRPKPPPSFTLLVPAAEDDLIKLTRKGAEKYAGDQKGKLNVVTLTGQPSSDNPKATSAVAQKPTVVIAVRVNPEVVLKQVATRPDQQFLLVDDACATRQAKNVTCLQFREHEGVYLLGAEAGLLTTTGKLGAVVAMDIPILKRFWAPFGQGAAAVKPGTTMSQVFVPAPNHFQDPVAAETLAKQLGASHVMAVAFGGNRGVFKAAKDSGFSTFGMDVNECPNGNGTVVDSVIKRTDIAVADGLKAIADKAGGKAISYGLKENGISLASLEPDAAASQCTVAGRPDVLDKVKEIREKIISGELRVEDPSVR
jgi:basic membrane protein A